MNPAGRTGTTPPTAEPGLLTMTAMVVGSVPEDEVPSMTRTCRPCRGRPSFAGAPVGPGGVTPVPLS